MRGRFAGLTTRGRAFLAAGIAAAACAFVLGQKDLLRIAILLAILPILTILVVARERYRLAALRTVVPSRIAAGQQATVHLRLENAGRMPTGLLLLEDQVPYALRSRPRFVLDRMSAHWRGDLSYPVSSRRRGRFLIGPLNLRVTDPFGFVDLNRSFQTQDALLVTPTVHSLAGARLGGEWASSGESRPRAAAAAGEEDVTVREYRHGDDLRRVHWRSSARRGELMVRREEQPWQSRATILLDTRTAAHRGHGADSSFEWAVSAAASVGVHLLGKGYAVRLVTDGGASLSTVARESTPIDYAEGMLLDALAVVETSSAARLDNSMIGLPHDGSHGLLVAVFGTLAPIDVEQLVRLKQQATATLAIVCATPTWAPSKERHPEQVDQQLTESVGLLRRSGWQVAVAEARHSVPEVWNQLVHADQVVPTGPAHPAAAGSSHGGSSR